MLTSKTHGFSLIELLLAVALILVVGAMSAPFAGSFLQRIYLENARQALYSSLLRAQANTMSHYKGAVWGLCRVGEDLVVYTGSCNARISEERWHIPGNVAIDNFTDVVFEPLRGLPSSTQQITVSSTLGSALVTVNSAGGISAP